MPDASEKERAIRELIGTDGPLGIGLTALGRAGLAALDAKPEHGPRPITQIWEWAAENARADAQWERTVAAMHEAIFGGEK